MQVSVDNDRCTGHARCWALAPDLYTLDDDGYSNIGTAKPVPPGQEDAARRGAAACPERALTVDEG